MQSNLKILFRDGKCEISWGSWVWEGREHKDVVFEEEPVIYNDQVFVLITVQDTTPVIEDNVQTIDIVPEQDNNEVLPQIPLEQPQQPQEVSLRRSIRGRRNTISNDYIIFLQEHKDGVGLTEDDPINFCQAIHNSNS